MRRIKRKDWPVAIGLVSVLLLFYGTVCALAADMKVIPKDYSAIRSWICGYSAGFEDGIRKLDDPRQPESEQ
jgi:hypothetical protein